MKQVIFHKTSFMKDGHVGFSCTFFWVPAVYRTQNRVTGISRSVKKAFLSCPRRRLISTAGVLWCVSFCGF